MAKRGGRRHLKRLAASKHVPIKSKKKYTFIAKPLPGPHTGDRSISLVSLLRDVIGVTTNARETSFILSKGAVKVDGKERRDKRFPVGLMDTIAIEGDKVYRVAIGSDGKLSPVEAAKGTENEKPLKIKRKKSISKDEFQLTFHDGTTMVVKDKAYKLGDVLLVSLDKREVVKHIPLTEGANCLVIEGKHAGLKARLKEQKIKGTSKEAVLESDGKEVITKSSYLFALPEGW
ncbi:MAG: 30S ribosomal protein S4e [Methanobacteriota archaeon]|nr:MAG: 30S ribosomal protein S4e [Euryarchaeota archaeon]